MAPTLAILLVVALVAVMRNGFIETEASEVNCTALLGPERGPKWRDCDGDASNHCETFIFGDLQNCGWCHHECYNVRGPPPYRTGVSCYGGLCQYQCDPMTKDCDDDVCDPYSKDCRLDLSNGCEGDINQSDPHNCGYLPDAITEVPPGHNSSAPNWVLSNFSSAANCSPSDGNRTLQPPRFYPSALILWLIGGLLWELVLKTVVSRPWLAILGRRLAVLTCFLVAGHLPS